MSNYPSMSYCKYENTLAHMEQIEEYILGHEGEEDLSMYEARAKERILKKIREWAEELELLDD